MLDLQCCVNFGCTVVQLHICTHFTYMYKNLIYIYIYLMLAKSLMHVCQVASFIFDPMYCSPPGSSVQGIFQARILEWVAISS